MKKKQPRFRAGDLAVYKGIKYWPRGFDASSVVWIDCSRYNGTEDWSASDIIAGDLVMILKVYDPIDAWDLSATDSTRPEAQYHGYLIKVVGWRDSYRTEYSDGNGYMFAHNNELKRYNEKTFVSNRQ